MANVKDKILIGINPRHPHARDIKFYDPMTGLHIGGTNPVGYVNVVSENILRGLKGGILIDPNNCVDLKNEPVDVRVITNPTQESINSTINDMSKDTNKTIEDTKDTTEDSKEQQTKQASKSKSKNSKDTEK